MLAYSGSNMLCIKTGNFPPHMQKLQGPPETSERDGSPVRFGNLGGEEKLLLGILPVRFDNGEREALSWASRARRSSASTTSRCRSAGPRREQHPKDWDSSAHGCGVSVPALPSVQGRLLHTRHHTSVRYFAIVCT